MKLNEALESDKVYKDVVYKYSGLNGRKQQCWTSEDGTSNLIKVPEEDLEDNNVTSRIAVIDGEKYQLIHALH